MNPRPLGPMRPEAQSIQRQIQHLTMELAKLESQPVDNFEDGSVITFEKVYNDGRVYNYAAIKAAGKWYATGRSSASSGGRNWDQMWDFIHNGQTTAPEIWVVTAMEPLA